MRHHRHYRCPNQRHCQNWVGPLQARRPSPWRTSEPEPQISTTPEMRSGRACLLRHILLAYFRAHAPEGVHKVENLVARVVGGPPSEVNGMVVGGVLWDEATLFGKLEAKYGARVDLDPPP